MAGKKIIPIAAALILIVACKNSKESPYKENIMKFENGNIKRRYYTDAQGQIQDTMFDYFSTGEISKIRLFKNNKQEGRSTYYLKEGSLYEIQHLVDGKIEGMDSVFYPSGKIKVLAEFKDGLRNGSFKSFLEDGSVEKEYLYRNDSLLIRTDSSEVK
ncbi:MAG: hypothetical protein U0V49_02840 [Saprospiraceae bacterium]